MKMIVSIIASLLLCGCARWLVPVSTISGTVANQPFSISSPKNGSLSNLVVEVTVRNQFGETNRASVHIGYINFAMDPVVVQMSGEAFNRALESAIAGAVEGSGKATKP